MAKHKYVLLCHFIIRIASPSMIQLPLHVLSYSWVTVSANLGVLDNIDP